MRKLIVWLWLPLVAGCLSASQQDITVWDLQYQGVSVAAKAPKYDVARVSLVQVRAPFDQCGIAVLRGDGSMAFDPCQEYAALPSSLLKGVLADGLSQSGMFKSVIGSSSVVHATHSVETTVTRLALDCREDGRRTAVADLSLRVVEGRDIVAFVKGHGSADAASGNYGLALSMAVSAAIDEAMSSLGK